MDAFELPHDFEPTTKKNYGYQGVHFEVWVQDKGLQPQTPTRAPHLLWIFAVWVQGRIVECGKYHWDPSDRKTTDEEVCNYIFTYHQNSPKVRYAIQQPYKFEPIRALDNIIRKCVAYMFERLTVEQGAPLYDIVAAKNDREGWHVILSTPLAPGRFFEFSCMFDNKKTVVSTYTKAHQHSAELD